jgi:hypothetical protein
MIPDAVIAHASPGRLRIKIPSQRWNLAALKAQGDQLAACPGILSIEINRETGSVLLIHQTTVRDIAEYARSRDLFSLAEKMILKTSSATRRRDLGETFRRIDRQLQDVTGGEVNLSGFAAAALVVAGSAQILSGTAGPIPWSAAYWYAYNLYSRTKDGEKKERPGKSIEGSGTPPV